MAEPTSQSMAAVAEPPAQPIAAANSAPIEAAETEDDNADSAYETEGVESTASVASSILEYRSYRGRAYHSKTHDSRYFVPTDDLSLDNFDIMHHFLTLLLDDKLHLAPIKPDATKILDIGTGTGIWAIDFADEHPDVTVIGTDLSPVQPTWVPPNVSFEIDDCAKDWTWDADSFDFVHVRYLFGAIRDWTALFKQAYRTLKPGAYLESVESEPTSYSDDGSVADDGKTALGGRFGAMFREAGKVTGNSMSVITDNIQVQAMKDAGFVDVQVITHKVPMGSWPKDPKLSQIGAFAKMSLESDLSGYTQLIWHEILRWPADEFEVFMMKVRQELKDKKLHPYFHVRYVWGRKPETAESADAAPTA